MKGRFFLDTNIFVYAFDQTSPSKARKATELIADAVSSRKGLVSYQVVQEFLNVALKRFAVPMTIAEAEHYLSVVFQPLLVVHSSHALIADALHLSGRYRFSWYDSLIVAAAQQAECSMLYSEDLQHGFQIGELRVHNPFH